MKRHPDNIPNQGLYVEDFTHQDFFKKFGVSKLQVWRAVAREAFLDNPEVLATRIYGHAKENYFNTNKIPEDEFKSRYANAGFEWTPQMTFEEAEVIFERKRQEAANAHIISSGEGGFVEGAGAFGTAILTSFASPVNIGLSLVPIGGQARWAQLAARAGRFPAMIAKGATSNAVFQAGFEPFLKVAHDFEQSPYGLGDSIHNVTIAAVFGASLHSAGYGFKKLKDHFFSTPERLHTHFEHPNPILREDLRQAVNGLARETHYQPEPLDLSRLDPALRKHLAGEPPLESLRQLKGNLFEEAYKNPDLKAYLEAKSSAALLNEQLHDHYKTGGNSERIPTADLESLASHEALADAHADTLKGHPDFEHYQASVEELDKAIRNSVRELQYETKAYDVSIGDLIRAKSQIDDGKYVNLDAPEKAESWYAEDARPALEKSEAAIIDSPVPISKETQSFLAEAIQAIQTHADPKIQEQISQALTASSIPGKEALIHRLNDLHKTVHFEEFVPREAVDKKIQACLIEAETAQTLFQRDQSFSKTRLEDSYRFVKRYKSPSLGIKNLLKQVELRQKATAGEFRNGFFYDLDQAGLVYDLKTKVHERDIAVELEALTRTNAHMGITQNPKAQKMAEIINKWQMIGVNRANQAGASIVPLEGYITRQTHSAYAIRKLGRDGWINLITPLLDHPKTFGDGTVDLKSVYEALSTGKHFTALDEYTHNPYAAGGSDVATRLAAPRKLHFKDADAWLAYNEACGQYGLADSIVMNLERLGESTGLMEGLGTNPSKTLENLQDTLQRELREKASMSQEDQKELTKIGKKHYNGLLEWMMGHNSPDNPTVAMIAAAARNVKTMSSLGKVAWSSLPDMSSFAVELQNNGVSLGSSYLSIIKAIAYSMSSKEKKSLGRMLGIACDNVLGSAYERLNAESPVPGIITKTTNFFFKVNCMEWWDRSFKNTIGMVLSNHLAELSGQPFRALPRELQRILEGHGLQEAQWASIKKGVQTIEGNAYLIPDKIENAEAAGVIRRYLLDCVETGIATPGQAERYIAFLGTRPGTALGEGMRFLMQFKTFPITFILKPLKAFTVEQLPIAERTGNAKDIVRSFRYLKTWQLMSQALAGTTVLGYLSICAGKLMKGEEMPDLVDSRAWAAAAIKGGGLGLYGDFIFGEYSRYGRTFMAESLGPAAGFINDLAALFTDAKNGEWDNGRKAKLKSIRKNVPFQNLFYTEWLLDWVMEEYVY